MYTPLWCYESYDAVVWRMTTSKRCLWLSLICHLDLRDAFCLKLRGRTRHRGGNREIIFDTLANLTHTVTACGLNWVNLLPLLGWNSLLYGSVISMTSSKTWTTQSNLSDRTSFGIRFLFVHHIRLVLLVSGCDRNTVSRSGCDRNKVQVSGGDRNRVCLKLIQFSWASFKYQNCLPSHSIIGRLDRIVHYISYRIIEIEEEDVLSILIKLKKNWLVVNINQSINHHHHFSTYKQIYHVNATHPMEWMYKKYIQSCQT